MRDGICRSPRLYERVLHILMGYSKGEVRGCSRVLLVGNLCKDGGGRDGDEYPN